MSRRLKRITIEDRRAAGTRTSLRATYSGIESSDLVLSNIPVSYQEDMPAAQAFCACP